MTHHHIIGLGLDSIIVCMMLDGFSTLHRIVPKIDKLSKNILILCEHELLDRLTRSGWVVAGQPLAALCPTKHQLCLLTRLSITPEAIANSEASYICCNLTTFTETTRRDPSWRRTHLTQRWTRHLSRQRNLALNGVIRSRSTSNNGLMRRI